MEIKANNLFPQGDIPNIQFTAKKQERLDDNIYAQLELKTQKIRKRLEQRLNAMDKHITHQRLEETKGKIRGWIERHSQHRVPIKKNSLHLFTGGKEAAPMSARIAQIRQRLGSKISEEVPQSGAHELKGRVTKSS